MNNDKSNLKLINNSFYLTYVFLITTGTITFIEAIRTKVPEIRNILNLETCISIIAAYFYGEFVKKLNENKDKEQVDYKKINETRYLDWSITTPIMLLVLVLAFLYNSKGGRLNFFTFLLILFLNYGMLYFGYLGEQDVMDKNKANMIGFIFFFALYYFIYRTFLHNNYNFDNLILYLTFLILWTMYGVLYFYDEVTKNVGYNVLDLFSKCFVGIFFWAYYTKVFVL
jgi:bacteriorhodopsin